MGGGHGKPGNLGQATFLQRAYSSLTCCVPGRVPKKNMKGATSPPPPLLPEGRSTRLLKLSHMVHSRGNNAVPIFRALESRAPFWHSEKEGSGSGGGGAGAASGGSGGGGGHGGGKGEGDKGPKDDSASVKVWTANVVWKPTWAKLKPPPADFQRGCKDLRRRQVVNHLVAVEPLCTKDDLANLMSKYYKVRGVGVKPSTPLGSLRCWYRGLTRHTHSHAHTRTRPCPRALCVSRGWTGRGWAFGI
jgi:hypothetical protein